MVVMLPQSEPELELELEPLIVILECYNLKQNWDCISRALV